MKALRKTEPGAGGEIVEIGKPEIGPHDLLVRVRATAMCKSDIEVIEWSPLVASANYALPFTMGHEFAGEVVAVGELVKGYRAGDKVAGETHIPCGTCHECRTDNQHICTNNMGVLGRNVDGSFAEYIRLPEISAIRLEADADLVEMSLLEPLGTALHGLQKADVSGKTVAILGVGTIGLMACELAKVLGAIKVIAMDINEARLANSQQAAGINNGGLVQIRILLFLFREISIDSQAAGDFSPCQLPGICAVCRPGSRPP